MTMLFMDGFDHYDTDSIVEKYDFVQTGSLEAEIDNSFGRFVNGSIQMQDNNTGFITKVLKQTSDEIIVGYAFFFTGVNLLMVRFKDDTGTTIATHANSGTGGEVFRGTNSGTSLGTYSGAWTTSTWQFAEIRCKRHPTLGEFEVRANGVIKFSATGLNTGAVDFDQIDFRPTGQNANDLWMDDMYILNTQGSAPQNSFLGDVRVTALLPKANGNTNNFTPTGASSNFEAVDEAIADQDATFVEAGQLGAKEDYNNKDFADLGLSPGTIFGVQVVNSTKKTDAGRLDYKDQMIIAGTAFDQGTDVVATAVTYKMSTFIRDTDPSDSAAWTEAKVAAVGSGLEITFREV